MELCQIFLVYPWAICRPSRVILPCHVCLSFLCGFGLIKIEWKNGQHWASMAFSMIFKGHLLTFNFDFDKIALD